MFEKTHHDLSYQTARLDIGALYRTACHAEHCEREAIAGYLDNILSKRDKGESTTLSAHWLRQAAERLEDVTETLDVLHEIICGDHREEITLVNIPTNRKEAWKHKDDK